MSELLHQLNGAEDQTRYTKDQLSDLCCEAADEIGRLRTDNERLRAELGRAYRALTAYTNARDKGVPLSTTAVAYHSLSEAAAKRFVHHGALDGSEYFIGKSVGVLHAALRGEEWGHAK